MDKAFLLQKQVRENSEDLQKELRDMIAWEEQMKKKDFEIRNTKDDQVLPPVRRKKKKTKSQLEASTSEKPSKTKRIAGSDYNSWNKFDADKACKEVDGENESKEKEEKIFEIPSKEELEKEHAEAMKYKDEGNILVQQKEYAKAVGKYSQAIKIFPGDAVFYANRALCQLKLDNLYSADADCTAAIKLDENYIKAYHRRATARIELKRYEDAKKDLEKILELEPSHKEAALKLKQVQEKIDKAPKMVISGEEKNKKSAIEKVIGQKLFGKKESNSVQDVIEGNKSNKQNENESIKIEEIRASTSKDEKIVIENIEEKKNDSEEKKKEITKRSNAADKLPPWLPKLKKDITIIEPLKETPSKLKEKLKRIVVKEISETESIFSGIEDTPEDLVDTEVIKEKYVPATRDVAKPENKSSDNSNNINSDTKESENLPPPPKSSVGFLLSWRKNASINFRYHYLKQIEPKDLPNIFKESMEPSIFSDILSILKSKFIPNKDKIYNWLYYLTQVKRFSALILFMTQEDKEALKTLLKYCKTEEDRTDEEIKNLHSAYEM